MDVLVIPQVDGGMRLIAVRDADAETMRGDETRLVARAVAVGEVDRHKRLLWVRGPSRRGRDAIREAYIDYATDY